MDPIYELQAEICRTLSHPVRIAMLHLLEDEPREVGRLASDLQISQPNASQHLAVMRSAGLVEAERDGRGVTYRLADPGVIGACDLMSQVMRRRLLSALTITMSWPTTKAPIASLSAID